MDNFDLVIAGGGPVAGVLAALLADTPWNTAIITPAAPTIGNRAIALNHSSRQILQSLGIWDQVASNAGEIARIEVSRRGEPGKTHLNANDLGDHQLGWVVPERTLLAAINQCQQNTATLTTITATTDDIDQTDAAIALRLNTAATISARLAIGADGFNSGLRRLAGVQFRDYDFKSSAISATLTTTQPHHQRAWECFTDSGPIALLPLADPHGYSLVWCADSADAEALLHSNEDDFLATLRQAFGTRAGDFSDVSERELFPLVQRTCRSPRSDRLLLIGSAARHLHPVGGQGLNLALRDVAVLADLLAQVARERGDPGTPSLLSHYCQLRRNDWRTTEQFSRHCPGLFARSGTPLTVGRNLALTALELLPPLRRLFVRRTAGQLGFRATARHSRDQ
jgi:2-octaprenyl-6-methoxyphenol hydroxylase